MSLLGTRALGIRTPIIKEGDDLVKIVADSVIDAAKMHSLELNDNDVVCVTEAVVAIAQGNFVSIDDVAADVARIFKGCDTVCLVHPAPLSRNRFINILKGIAKGVKKLVVIVQPVDEVGNSLLKEFNPYEVDLNLYTAAEFVKKFGKPCHKFTGIDYLEAYQAAGDNIEMYVSASPVHATKLSENVIAGTIHTKEQLKNYLIKNGAKRAITLSDIVATKTDKHGYNEEHGVLGSNMAGDNKLKLFPRDAKKFAFDLQAELLRLTSSKIECMVYGDGAFKDPVGGIWELADPVVSPGFTDGLKGTSRPEVKLKNLAAQYAHLPEKERDRLIKEAILKQADLPLNDPARLGTTPRQLPDLLGSLADLATGSGSKGTPVVLVQDYFVSRY